MIQNRFSQDETVPVESSNFINMSINPLISFCSGDLVSGNRNKLVKIHLLGEFKIYVDNEFLPANVRPFDVLKVLLAYGGKSVDEALIMDALWPDAEGDRAVNSFHTTLHRLRKNFDGLDILQLQNHKLSLNEKLCWTDTWELVQLFRCVQSRSVEKSVNKRVFIAAQILETYQGKFLHNETANWAIPSKEKYHRQYLRHLITIARDLEKIETVEIANALYQQLLEIDPFAEEAIQGLERASQLRKAYMF